MATTLMLETPMLTAALQYAALGWRIFPCHTPIVTASTEEGATCSCVKGAACMQPGKHPRTIKGLTDATCDPAQIEKWWRMWPTANIAGLPGSVGTCAFDLDSDQSISTARELGLFAEPTYEVRTGNGVHRYYQSPPFPSGATVRGIVVRSMHGYVLLPPSLHYTGRHYEVADATPAIPLPPAVAQEAQRATSSEGAKARVQLATSAERIAPGNRHDVLLALAGSLAARWVPAETAAQLVYDANVARCDPPKPREEVEALVAFAYGKEQEKHAEVARHLVISTRPAAAPTVPTSAPANPLDSPLPGVLEDIVQYAMYAANHPVRLYAVAAALAAASVLCARRYATTANNFSSLYFLIVGRSGTGKEHARRVVHAILRAADVPSLIGPMEWTSRSAVWSSVYDAPQSIAILDEFGQFLGAASGGSDGATMKNGVLTALMELYGRLDDTAITPQFSTLALSDKQRKQTARKMIERPALSLMGLTTPDEWYDSLKGNRISSGFLNRFLVLEADVPLGDLTEIASVDAIPEEITQWAVAIMKPHGDLDVLGRKQHIPAPRVLSFTPEAFSAFSQFKRECNRRADRLVAEKLGELPVRATEQAMRLGLIAALARDPSAQQVQVDDAEWGIAVASYLLGQLIPAVQSRLADNHVHALRNRLLDALHTAGERGLTQREMAKLPVFRAVVRRERDEAIQWVQEAEHAAWSESPSGPQGGRPRYALRFCAVSSTDDAS